MCQEPKTGMSILSRIDRPKLKRSLKHALFCGITVWFGSCDIDLFTPRINAKLERFLSWGLDQEAWGADASSIDWSKFKLFCFAPFSLIP